jgi:hypothetical protein
MEHMLLLFRHNSRKQRLILIGQYHCNLQPCHWYWSEPKDNCRIAWVIINKQTNKQTDKVNIDLKYIVFAHALAHEKEYLVYAFEHLPRRQNARATCSMFRWACLTKSCKYRSEKWVCHYQCAKHFTQKKKFTTSTCVVAWWIFRCERHSRAFFSIAKFNKIIKDIVNVIYLFSKFILCYKSDTCPSKCLDLHAEKLSSRCTMTSTVILSVMGGGWTYLIPRYVQYSQTK